MKTNDVLQYWFIDLDCSVRRCRTKMFDQLQRGGENSITIPITKSNEIIKETTIPVNKFDDMIQAELKQLSGSNLKKSNNAWEVLEKYLNHHQ